MPFFAKSASLLDLNPQIMVWLQTSFLGDVVLTTAAVRLAKKKWPDCRQILLTTPVGYQALKDTDCFDELIVFDKRNQRGILSIWRLAKALKARTSGYRAVMLQVHRSFRSSIFSAFSNMKVISYHESCLSFLANSRVSRVAPFHEAVRIALLLEPLGVSREEIVQVVPDIDHKCHQAPYPDLEQPLANGKVLIAIAPGSVWATKRWPANYFSNLILKLIENIENLQIVLLGGQNEVSLANQIQKDVCQENLITNLVGKTSLADLHKIYPHLTMLVSNDSAPVHYASAYQVPSVCVFGPTVSKMGFGPLADGSEVAEIDLECRPCSDHGPQRCPLGHFKCMLELSVDMVLERSLAVYKAATKKIG